MQAYRRDLAYVHDAGFSDYALKAAPGLLQILRKTRVPRGLVVDLGCGSGRWAAALNQAGFQVLGVDQSASMIDLARRVAPRSRFRIGSLLKAELPECDAVTSIGECLNYSFDKSDGRKALQRLFRAVYRALRPGGVFIFDIAEPSRLPKKLPQSFRRSGPDWALLVTIDGDPRQHILRRHITCFRKISEQYRRSEETHVLRLYQARDLIYDLLACGFEARKVKAYGRFQLPPGMAAIVATKPSWIGA